MSSAPSIYPFCPEFLKCVGKFWLDHFRDSQVIWLVNSASGAVTLAVLQYSITALYPIGLQYLVLQYNTAVLSTMAVFQYCYQYLREILEQCTVFRQGAGLVWVSGPWPWPYPGQAALTREGGSGLAPPCQYLTISGLPWVFRLLHMGSYICTWYPSILVSQYPSILVAIYVELLKVGRQRPSRLGRGCNGYVSSTCTGTNVWHLKKCLNIS